MPVLGKSFGNQVENDTIEVQGSSRSGLMALKMQSAGGVLYPPQPSPFPIPQLPDIQMPTPKDVGDWMDDLFGKKQPGTTTGGPDPNDKDKYDKFRKAGKKYDKDGK